MPPALAHATLPQAALCLAATTAVCAALAAGPLSRAARRYVHALPPGVPVRRAALLLPLPQALASGAAAALLGAHALTCLATAQAAGPVAPGATRSPASTVLEAVLTLPVTTVLLTACCVDVVCHRLPNRLLAVAAALAATGALARWALTLAASGPQAATALAAHTLAVAGAAGGAMLLLSLAPSGLGMGDVKLTAVLGLWLGHHGATVTVQALTTALLLGGATALVLVLTRQAGPRAHIALGPSLLAGGVVAWAAALPGAA